MTLPRREYTGFATLQRGSFIVDGSNAFFRACIPLVRTKE